MWSIIALLPEQPLHAQQREDHRPNDGTTVLAVAVRRDPKEVVIIGPGRCPGPRGFQGMTPVSDGPGIP